MTWISSRLIKTHASSFLERAIVHFVNGSCEIVCVRGKRRYMCSTSGSSTCPLGQPWDWRASTSQLASSDTMNSAPHLCGPQIRPGLTSLQPSILLLAPTLGLAFPGCVWTVCFKHWDRNPPGGSWGDVRGAVEEVREIQIFCFLPLALGNAEPPPQPRCLFPCRLSLSLWRGFAAYHSQHARRPAL